MVLEDTYVPGSRRIAADLGYHGISAEAPDGAGTTTPGTDDTTIITASTYTAERSGC